MVEFFKIGGWGMFPTAFFGVLLLGVASAYALRPERRWIPLLVANSIMTLLAGALGFVTGLMATTLGGVPAGEPGNRMLLSMVGFGESLANVALALGLCALATVVGMVGAARQAAQKPAQA